MKFNALKAQDVHLGENTTTLNYEYPVSVTNSRGTDFYKYSLTQQIYLGTSINKHDGGTIDKIKFRSNGKNVTRNIDVYVENTDIESYTSTQIYAVNSATLCYSGNVEFKGDDDGWVTIDITDFTYEGDKNILLTIYDKTGTAVSSGDDYKLRHYTYKQNSDYMSAYKFSKTDTNFNPTNTTTGASRKTYTNEIIFTFSADDGGDDDDDNTDLPTAVTNLSPSDGSMYGTSPNQKLEWEFGDNTTHYQVLVGTEKEDGENGRVKNTLGQQDFVEKDGGINGSYTIEGLEPSTKYFWQVISRNGEDATSPETAGPVWGFTTIAQVDEKPTMVVKKSPKNNTIIKTQDVSLKWQYQDENATRYLVYLGTSIDGMVVIDEGQPNYSTTGLMAEFKPDNLQGETQYFWRVDVKNSIETPDENIWSFTTQSVGNIDGIVKNNDVFISGATISIKDLNGNLVGSTTTAGSGNFAFNDVLIGEYSLLIEAVGMEPYIINLVVEAGKTTSLGTIYLPSIIATDNSWTITNAELSENNELIVRANAVLRSTAKIGSLTIESGKSVTIKDGAVLTVVGKINNNGEIIIEDGGQIYQSNPNIEAIFKMNINNPDDWENDNTGGWQFISSPFTNALVSDFTDDIEGEYDLYKYNGTQKDAEWDNQKNDEEFEKEFVSGRGYLASYQIEETAEIRGILNSSTIFSLDNIYFTYENHYANYHLLGNPFPFDMDWSKLDDYTYNVVNGYAVLLEDGSYDYKKDGIIKAGDGFFIRTIGKSASIYYDHNKTSKNRGQSSYIDVVASGKDGQDNVIVSLSGQSEGFPKLENFNNNISNLYVKNENVRYGIFNCDDSAKEVELFFDVKKMGNYTISALVKGKFEYAVLVDRTSGVETDLLIDTYSFTAMNNDRPDRFLLKFSYKSQSDIQENFAYQSGEELIVDAKGMIQIVDVMGRIVYSNDVDSSNNRIDVSGFKSAAYIIRNIGDNGVRTQKIVIL